MNYGCSRCNLDGFLTLKFIQTVREKVCGLIWFDCLLKIKPNQINVVWVGSIFYNIFIDPYIHIWRTT